MPREDEYLQRQIAISSCALRNSWRNIKASGPDLLQSNQVQRLGGLPVLIGIGCGVVGLVWWYTSKRSCQKAVARAARANGADVARRAHVGGRTSQVLGALASGVTTALIGQIRWHNPFRGTYTASEAEGSGV